jgi:hypothetical protein
MKRGLIIGLSIICVWLAGTSGYGQLPDPPGSPVNYDVEVNSDIEITADIVPEIFARGVATGLMWAVNDDTIPDSTWEDVDGAAINLWNSNSVIMGVVASNWDMKIYNSASRYSSISGMANSVTGVYGLISSVGSFNDAFYPVTGLGEDWDYTLEMPWNLVCPYWSNTVSDLNAYYDTINWFGSVVFTVWRCIFVMALIRICVGGAAGGGANG